MMYERDYLLKLLADLVQGILRSMELIIKEDDPYMAARSLETAIGNAVDMDAMLFLSLSPQSMADMMSISSMDAAGAEYVARSLALASVYNRKAGDTDLADLRMQQAYAVANAYGHDLGEMDFDANVSIEEATELMRSYIDEADNR